MGASCFSYGRAIRCLSESCTYLHIPTHPARCDSTYSSGLDTTIAYPVLLQRSTLLGTCTPRHTRAAGVLGQIILALRPVVNRPGGVVYRSARLARRYVYKHCFTPFRILTKLRNRNLNIVVLAATLVMLQLHRKLWSPLKYFPVLIQKRGSTSTIWLHRQRLPAREDFTTKSFPRTI